MRAAAATLHHRTSVTLTIVALFMLGLLAALA